MQGHAPVSPLLEPQTDERLSQSVDRPPDRWRSLSSPSGGPKLARPQYERERSGTLPGAVLNACKAAPGGLCSMCRSLIARGVHRRNTYITRERACRVPPAHPGRWPGGDTETCRASLEGREPPRRQLPSATGKPPGEGELETPSRSPHPDPPQNRHVITWLILPVVICLSQRLSHACVSTGRSKAKPRMAH